jgi:queuine tRNA-ribosyltransferase
MSFKILARDGKARCGRLETPHGVVDTPVFMPVATQASVKAISQENLTSLGARAILANSYHLYLRPGTALIKAAGGLHKFMDYDGMILTDSGGFQVMSLADLRKIEDKGVVFKSHIDGSTHDLTPEKVIDIQSDLASDCWTTLDECASYEDGEARAAAALERTLKWTDRSIPAVAAKRDAGSRSLFFPILQGGLFPELRRRAAEHMARVPCDGIAMGGFSVGEPKPLTWEVVDQTTEWLAEDKPRYLMGVGTPEELWQAVACGVDMLDCVFPTRVARNGQVMTKRGRFNITQSACRADFGPLDSECACFVCRRYSRAYLAHLYRAKELVIYQLLSYHNLHCMADVAADIRRAIAEGRFTAKRREFLDASREFTTRTQPAP